jgi:hypothetical protein
MRIFFLSFFVLATDLRAAEEPTVSRVASNSLAEVRVAIQAFCSRGSTNVALRPFVSGTQAFWSGAVEEMATASGIRIPICDCETPSPCYEISATSISAQTSRIEIRSLDTSTEEGRVRFRPKRNAGVMEELVRLLGKKS